MIFFLHDVYKTWDQEIYEMSLYLVSRSEKTALKYPIYFPLY